jgi:hypothetical protein
VSSELKMVLVTFTLITIGILAFIWGSNLPNCYEIEYQNLSGTHHMTVCEDK